jgi:hypothetical protein
MSVMNPEEMLDQIQGQDQISEECSHPRIGESICLAWELGPI